jgi:hypothetical protein
VNRGATRHGIYAIIPLSKLGPPFTYLDKVSRQVTKALREMLQSRQEKLTTYQLKRLTTFRVAFRRALCVAKVLADAGAPGTEGGLSHEHWLAYSDRELRYHETADKCLKDLDLDKEVDPWQQLYASMPPYGSPVAPGPHEQPTTGPEANESPSTRQDVDYAAGNATGPEAPGVEGAGAADDGGH